LLQPKLEIAIEPITFRFWSAPRGNSRPLFVASQWTLWHGDGKSIAAETAHEVGKNPFNRFSVVLELYERNGAGGRLQLFVTGSPGNELHVSPNVGAFRDGISLGVRVKFRE
jgi:hypothetical protein